MGKSVGIRRGVTLIELIVAMAIMGIVLTTILMVLSQTQRTYKVQNQQIQSDQDLRLAMSQITRDVRKATLVVVQKGALVLDKSPVFSLKGNELFRDNRLLLKNVKNFSPRVTGSKIDIEIVILVGAGGSETRSLVTTLYKGSATYDEQ